MEGTSPFNRNEESGLPAERNESETLFEKFSSEFPLVEALREDVDKVVVNDHRRVFGGALAYGVGLYNEMPESGAHVLDVLRECSVALQTCGSREEAKAIEERNMRMLEAIRAMYLYKLQDHIGTTHADTKG